MIEKFDKQDDQRFKEWLRENQDGFYLNKRPNGEMMLHKVDCWHLGDAEGMNSTTNLKVAAKDAKSLFIWAAKQGIKVNSCSVTKCFDAYTKAV